MCFIEKMQRALKEETQQLENDLNEERSRYQNLLTEHLRLEEKYDDLKEEITLSVVRTRSCMDYLTSHLENQLINGYSERLGWFRLRSSTLLLVKASSSLMGPFFLLECSKTWSQAHRLHTQQQRIRMYLQLRICRVRGRVPRRGGESRSHLDHSYYSVVYYLKFILGQLTNF